jgi:ribonucleoside-diphosphate reductase alpha chain
VGAAIKNNGTSSGSVHFMQPFENLIQVISQGSCYIEGTEVLTDSGFKDFRDVKRTDKIADLDENSNVSFTSQFELVVQDFEGDLVAISGRKRNDAVSIKVTPNHRMIVNRLKMKNREQYWSTETEIVEAKDLCLHRDNRLILSGWAGEGNGLTDEDRLRIAFQADGIKDGPNRKIRFHFSKERKIKRLIELLIKMRIPYDTYDNGNGTLDINFDYIESVKKNTFRDWICLDRISGTWAKEFLEEIAEWDGSHAHGGAILYCSTIKDNVDLVQAISALADLKTRLSVRPAKDNRQNLYKIIISEGAYRSGEALKVSQEHYKGKVYCAVVPKGRLIVRYEGRVLVCGNTRRGNLAAYLPIDHPDIMEFLRIRSDGAPIQDLSFGVCVPDYWMREMIGDASPKGGDRKKREVWARVLECRANIGYPYIFFPDAANRNAPDCYRKNNQTIKHTNLCTEIMLPNDEFESFVCDLSSMNILYYDEWKGTDAVELMVYFLDAVMSEFIRKAKKIQFMERPVRFAERHRALGIGWLGWHTYLQSKMIPWESMEAKTHNVMVAKNIRNSAYAASAKMATEYGEPEVLKGFGRRHATLLAIAPTKSSAFILGQVSEGIEPHRTNHYIKDLQKGKYTIRNTQLAEVLASHGKDNDFIWLDILKKGGTVQHLDFLSEHEKAVFKTFAEISQKEVIIQAAQRQKYIDQGQSLNLMIHPSIPTKEVNALMIEGWKMDIKSYYYQNSVNAAQTFARNILTCTSCEA